MHGGVTLDIAQEQMVAQTVRGQVLVLHCVESADEPWISKASPYTLHIVHTGMPGFKAKVQKVPYVMN